jgi:phosphoglycerate kinase
MPARPFHTLDEIGNISGKHVIVRAALNVPVENGVVRDDFRIKEACKTIQFLQKQGARVVVLAHLGRPVAGIAAPFGIMGQDSGNRGEVPQAHGNLGTGTLLPVSNALVQFLPHRFVSALFGDEVTSALESQKDGEVILLENVRSDVRETGNSDDFAKALAAYGDIYINDAFADSHRAHASIVGIPKYLPSYAGLSFVREYTELSKAFDPAHPALFVLGGAKFETKLPLVERFVQEYDHVFIGGAIANDFLKGKGYEVGTSVVSEIDLSASTLLTDPRIIIPTDVVVNGPSGKLVKAADAVAKDEKILDIGPKTMQSLAPVIAEAKTILWNGPLGHYEGGYDEATDALANMIADASEQNHVVSILGGGDTVAAIEKLGLNEKFTFISTAGGAMLEFLEKETLPGIEALVVDDALLRSL